MAKLQIRQCLQDREMAMYAKSMCEEKINRCLLEFSANPKLRARLQMMKETGLVKAEAAKAEARGSLDERTGKEDVGAEGELLDQSFATGENIDQPTMRSDKAAAEPLVPNEELVHKRSLPAVWDNTDPLVGDASEHDNEWTRYSSAQG